MRHRGCKHLRKSQLSFPIWQMVHKEDNDWIALGSPGRFQLAGFANKADWRVHKVVRDVGVWLRQEEHIPARVRATLLNVKDACIPTGVTDRASAKQI